jgi:alanyl-tRNA synthetase
MKAAEIRRRFLAYFEAREHRVVPSSSLVPTSDPTLLFTNAGMVQFKGIFQGTEDVDFDRAVTSQKCVRAGGKHNDLEEVGKTARHHTFFEMLGNFSFGDYFKREAIGFAWEFLTDDLGLEPERIFATVHHSDDEAAALWHDVAGLPRDRIYRLGDKDNFWQMADTGPCGPCSELLYDLRRSEDRGTRLATEAFEGLTEDGTIMELWNLVFMQFDRDAEGTMHPLPAPSIDTGAGLERLAAVLQGVDSNYHTDLFIPLLDRVAKEVGEPYAPDSDRGVGYRVLADHARAVAFLLADGVAPSNEGRGYVLRRILRRAERHAWLLGRREPTLVHVVDAVVDQMGGAFPELEAQRQALLRTTREEESRFLDTIEGGLARIDEIAPELTTSQRSESDARPIVMGADAFKLYDTFGFPLDLTELIAEERGYEVDVSGFEAALERQRTRSREARTVEEDASGEAVLTAPRIELAADASQEFVGYVNRTVSARVVAFRSLASNGSRRMAVELDRNPFYVEGGGQVSDTGFVDGDGWSLVVDDVRRLGDRVAVIGLVRGDFPIDVRQPLTVEARVDARSRHDTERNHTATHLLHAALRSVLGEHVRQKGSLVAPDRLRFDFAHSAPLGPAELAEVESRVNRTIFDDAPVEWSVVPYDAAIQRGAMALFGEKYGDEVRIVEIPDVSLELCGGTHVRHTGEIGPFKITGESGVAAGVRRIEAVTGPGTWSYFQDVEGRLEKLAALLKTPGDNVVNRARQLIDENAQLNHLLEELRAGGGAGETIVAEERIEANGAGDVTLKVVRLRAKDAGDARSYGDTFRAAHSGVAVVGAEYADGKLGLFVFVSDDLVGRGVHANELVRRLADLAGGSGGGRPHMAQGGVGSPDGLDRALVGAADVVRTQLGPDG